MDLAHKYFNGHTWRYVDHSSGLEPMQSFAFDDTFSESVGADLSLVLCGHGYINIRLF